MTELIENIRAIDPNAAEYLEKEFAPDRPEKKLKDPDDIICLFLRIPTPQGHAYWHEIYLKLCEEE